MHTECITVDGHGVLVATPSHPVVVGRPRLAALRGQVRLSAVDDALLDAVRAQGGRARVLVIRGVDDAGQRTWSFAEDLTEAEFAELGMLMVRSQLSLYRALAAEGVLLSLKVGWGPREANALQEGTLELTDQLASSGQLDPLDAWLLAHFSAWLLASYRTCRDRFLPRNLPRLLSRQVPLSRLLRQRQAVR